MLITVFTPAYNRASLLPRLYQSLLSQEVKNFEWVVVDDGSTDNTLAVMQNIINESKIKVTYYKQANSGKHIAINKGAELANGELFFIVDSDDYLVNNATQIIANKYEEIKDDPTYAGVSGRKGYSENDFIGTASKYADLHANALDFRYQHGIKGDMAEVIKTSILREFPFPVVSGEKFCTEAVLWFRVAEKYKFLWFCEIIYIAEYLEGGLSNNIFKIRKNSPIYTTMFYRLLEKMDIPMLQKIKANTNYWRFAKYLKIPFHKKISQVNIFYSLIGLPASLFFLIKDTE